MRNRIVAGFLAPLLPLAFATSSFAGPLVVDGNLADWGFTVADNNGSLFPVPVKPPPWIAVEDQSDTAGDGGYLGPHSGGQNYDVEALAVSLQDGRLFIAIASGQRPDNGLARYSPGDIRIVANNGNVYGIEVGGGAGGGAGSLITEGAEGSTYNLSSSGLTASYSPLASRLAGSVWRNPTWILDPIAHATPVQISSGGTYVGLADFAFSRDSLTTQHSVIEASIPLDFFEGATQLDVYWAPGCNNDILMVSDDIAVPEPGSFAILALGLACIGGARRMRRLPAKVG